ncbi:MAG: ABC transporter ATP-binding protein [Spirochaetes bacterium]|nr:ABC transporter ATP-binding protein [Spirochaetota bacterium]
MQSWLFVSLFAMSTLLFSVVQYVLPWVFMTIYDEYLTQKIQVPLPKIIGIFLTLLAVRSISISTNIYFRSILSISIVNSLKKKILNSIIDCRYSFFENRFSGDIVSCFLTEVEIVARVVVSIITGILFFVQIAIFLAVLLHLNSAIFAIYTGIIIAITVMYLSRKEYISEQNHRAIKITGEFYNYYFFTFKAIMDIKCYNLYSLQEKCLDSLLERNEKLILDRDLNEVILQRFVNILVALGCICVFVIGFDLLKHGNFSPGMFLILLLLSYVIIEPIIGIFDSLFDVLKGWTSIKKIKDELSLEEESIGKVPVCSFSHAVQFKNFNFCYNNGKQALNNLNIRILVNSFISIVGESGSGKSTIINILLKLYPVESEAVQFDGIDLSLVNTRDLRKIIRVMFQDGMILNDTIKNNIDLEGILDDKQVIELCRDMGLSDLIGRYPSGVFHQISEYGKSISGGEKQRMLLARCLARNPDVIILDEATSGVDLNTELKIINTLLKWKNSGKNRTIIAITHSPTFALHSNLIYVLSKGQIVETGCHEELMNLKRHYYSLFWETLKQKRETNQ